MYHSITIGDKNTWDDWQLLPEEDLFFESPSLKTNYLDVPGADGALDMSEILTGYPIYNNREGSLNFIIVNSNQSYYPESRPKKFQNIVSEIRNYLHGRRFKAVLDDDPGHYYEGRFAVEGVTPDPSWSKIGISYNIEPYKWTVSSTTEDAWIWDTFSFKDGVIHSSIFKNIQVTTATKQMNLTEEMVGRAPVIPTFVISSTNGQGVYIRLINTDLGIDITRLFANGSNKDPEFILYGNNCTIQFWVSSGTGTLSIDYRLGRL